MEKKNKRILMSIIGVIICGMSVGFFKCSVFGVDPFQTFMGGLDAIVPISFGTLYVITNICLLLFSAVNDRSKIGIATFVNLFLLGYVIDFSYQTLQKLVPSPGLFTRIVLMVIGIVIMCLASSFYFTANLGVSTYDAIALIISEKWKLMQFRFCRILCDLTCVVVGVVLYLASGKSVSTVGTIVGVGTILTAFCMGPLIDFFNRKIAQPFLQK